MTSSTATNERRGTSSERRQGPTRASRAPAAGEQRDGIADRRADENQQLVTFFIDGQHLAVGVLQVQEIIQPQPMTPIPTAEPHFAGLINLRGQIVTAVDLRLLLGFPPSADRGACMNLVVNAEGGAISLLFDGIGDVIHVANHMVERPPGTLDAKMRRFVRSVVKLDRDLLLHIDIDAVAKTQ